MKRMTEWIADALTVCGAAACVYGVSLIYLPAGVIAGGVAAIVIGAMIGRGSG